MTSAAVARTTYKVLHGRYPNGVWSAPGRVNLIGEHTDYNDGFVLPFAIPQRVSVAASARPDGRLAVATTDGEGAITTAPVLKISELSPGRSQGWSAYPSGVAWVLRERGYTTGANLVIASDVPPGAGLASSHALECATALALLGIAGTAVSADATSPTRRDLARWIQSAENDFVGAPTGILDQTASLLCTESHLLFYDVRLGTQEQIPFPASEHGKTLLVVDTRTQHEHTRGGYGARRRGTSKAARILGVRALRDIDVHMLDSVCDILPPELGSLVRHVVTENQRVRDVAELLKQGEVDRVGTYLYASHDSLRDDYRVSSPELDLVVDVARSAGAHGARMTGGGFGGSAIVVAETERVPRLTEALSGAFRKSRFTAPHIFTVIPSRGAGAEVPSRYTAAVRSGAC